MGPNNHELFSPQNVFSPRDLAAKRGSGGIRSLHWPFVLPVHLEGGFELGLEGGFELGLDGDVGIMQNTGLSVASRIIEQCRLTCSIFVCITTPGLWLGDRTVLSKFCLCESLYSSEILPGWHWVCERTNSYKITN